MPEARTGEPQAACQVHHGSGLMEYELGRSRARFRGALAGPARVAEIRF
jgi:hypothetical protein